MYEHVKIRKMAWYNMHFLEIHADNWYDIIRYATQLLNLTQMPGLITALPGWHVRWASWRSGIRVKVILSPWRPSLLSRVYRKFYMMLNGELSITAKSRTIKVWTVLNNWLDIFKLQQSMCTAMNYPVNTERNNVNVSI